MTQRTILITGCSSGNRLAAAHSLRARGWRVFASCRNPDDCSRLVAEGFESPRIELRDTESIRSGLQEVLAATGGKLDALFNNGARGHARRHVEDLPTEGLRDLFESNVIGWHDAHPRKFCR